MRKGSKVFCAGFGVARVEDYYARKGENGVREGYVVLNFAHLGLRTKLLLTAAESRLRPLSSPSEVAETLHILAGSGERLAGGWMQRRELVDKALKGTDLNEIARCVRDLNSLPAWDCPASQSDLSQLEKARNILASELSEVYSLSFVVAVLLIENTVRSLRVQLPRKRGRKPRGWRPEDDLNFADQPGLLAIT
jgi:RNA polymerase-interacting CarD/CdnL/TRCF family regulator